ncbi:MAG: hypothetical protein N2205_06490 [Candidatus Caldatribacterium sp.]|uniref:hypothetical protein n=1 Tax=Candidatus Caldatribacterium sp. TaxID=2282143 RepID=UPI00299591C2|nr:hypothetical protein [Candidatus Caldatribacterium sp.]MCX7730847.1 hypothetical protein [Candidatus Caldatribacterium sp.]MDW8081596.1 hypothetical protein [Candidatus Calescibacterium sp.]
MCYVGPLAGAVVTSVLWKKVRNTKVFWLNLLFWGGALFGVVDHLLNGELFLISENLGWDLALGGIITGVILLAWGGILALARKHPMLSRMLTL